MAEQIVTLTTPTITSANFSNDFDSLVTNINNNFKAIASLPYLKGAQGDSFKLVEKQLINDSGRLTKEGAGIFNIAFASFLKADKLFEENDNLAEIIDKCNAVAIVKCWNTIKNTNNKLYMYAVVNDANQEGIYYSGQYYYFIDPRITDLRDSIIKYNTGDKDEAIKELVNFVDLSGFFAFNGTEWKKVNFVPTIYYDEEVDDICWHLNGVKTGISALGMKGLPAESSALYIVKCTDITSTTDSYGEVSYVWGKSDNEYGWIDVQDAIEEGQIPAPDTTKIYNAIICGDADDIFFWVFGNIAGVDETKYNCYWDSSAVYNNFVFESNFIEWIKGIGKNEKPFEPRGILLPDKSKYEDESTEGVHTLWSDTDRDLHLTHTASSVDELVRNTDNEIEADAGTNLYIDNYDTQINKNLTVKNNLTVSDGNFAVGEKLKVTNDNFKVDTADLTIDKGKICFPRESANISSGLYPLLLSKGETKGNGNNSEIEITDIQNKPNNIAEISIVLDYGSTVSAANNDNTYIIREAQGSYYKIMLNTPSAVSLKTLNIRVAGSGYSTGHILLIEIVNNSTGFPYNSDIKTAIQWKGYNQIGSSNISTDGSSNISTDNTHAIFIYPKTKIVLPFMIVGQVGNEYYLAPLWYNDTGLEGRISDEITTIQEQMKTINTNIASINTTLTEKTSTAAQGSTQNTGNRA